MVQLTQGFGPVEPNQFLSSGCTVELHAVDGKTTVRTIGALWIGDPERPHADTSVPVLVHDARFEQSQPLLVEEAEMWLGYPAGASAGKGVTPIHRLRGLGDSWDIRTTLMLNRFSRHATVRIDGPSSVPTKECADSHDRSAHQALLTARVLGGPDALVQLLAELPLQQQIRLLNIMQDQHAPVMYAGSVLDPGSSKHLHSKVQVTHSDDPTSISGFNIETPPTWTQENPLAAHDTRTGDMQAFDLYDSDKLSTVALDILSLGTMIRAGWSFHFESTTNMIALPPDKQSRFAVELGKDDVVRLPHKPRTGGKASPLPEISIGASAPVMHAARVPEQLKYQPECAASP